MKNILKITYKKRALLFAAAGIVAAGMLLASCGGKSGGYGGGGGGMGMFLPPAAFSLTSPANGAMGVPRMPTLMWGASLYATGYYVYIKRDADPAYPAPVTVTTTSYSIPAALDASTLYDWKVTAFNTSGMATAGPFTFTTGL